MLNRLLGMSFMGSKADWKYMEEGYLEWDLILHSVVFCTGYERWS